MNVGASSIRSPNTAIRIFALLAPVGLLIWFTETHPAVVGNVSILSGFLLLEFIAVAVWHYDNWFFPAMMLIFVWAGSSLPFEGSASATRWVVLAVGGCVGVVRWAAVRESHHFLPVHLIAFLCVASAFVSAMVSSEVQISLLKSSSLFLLFLYLSFGARVAVSGRETKFFAGLVTGCEALSFFSGFSYVVLRFPFFGNPNSLGAVMGVAVVPILAWSLLIGGDRKIHNRRMVALCLAGYLLVNSGSRAGLLASTISVVVFLLMLRRGTLLFKYALCIAFVTASIGVLQPAGASSAVSAFADRLIYKGKESQGLLGSRLSPWQDTMSVIKESPWFGSGFGTDRLAQPQSSVSSFRTVGGTVREHGNSYLALLQYVGLLGAFPFLILLLLLLTQILRTGLWIRRTRDPRNYAVPLAMICLAGLLHAFFEDWLFAVGYYLCLLFWTSAFLLFDFLPRSSKRQPRIPDPFSFTPPIESLIAVLAGE